MTEMYEELVKRLRERAAWINFPHHGEESPTEDAKLMMDAAEAIEELLQKEKFHAFLWNVINPNDMQLYLEIYHSGNEKEDAG